MGTKRFRKAELSGLREMILQLRNSGSSYEQIAAYMNSKGRSRPDGSRISARYVAQTARAAIRNLPAPRGSGFAVATAGLSIVAAVAFVFGLAWAFYRFGS